MTLSHGVSAAEETSEMSELTPGSGQEEEQEDGGKGEQRVGTPTQQAVEEEQWRNG